MAEAELPVLVIGNWLIYATSRFQGKVVPADEVLPLVQSLNDSLDIIDTILSKQSFMAGRQYSLVDGFFMPLIHMLFKVGYEKLFLEREHVRRWWTRVSERPAWKKAVEPLDDLYSGWTEVQHTSFPTILLG
jgi:glutathione S-transferase